MAAGHAGDGEDANHVGEEEGAKHEGEEEGDEPMPQLVHADTPMPGTAEAAGGGQRPDAAAQAGAGEGTPGPQGRPWPPVES